MKGVFIILLVITQVTNSDAQTFSEWFKQKKTQKKYLIEQIVALEMYTLCLEKGYSIVHEGLSQINSIKHGEFDLHEGYFNSLQNINPGIKDRTTVNDILSLKRQIEIISKRVLKQTKAVKTLDPDQRDYIKTVFEKLLEGCQTNRDLLVQLLTQKQLQLKDDERLSKIGVLYDDMQEKYSFVRSFEIKIQQLEVNRLGEETEVKTIGNDFDITK